MVPTRDRPSLLAECLRSIRAVEGPDLTLEILVGDNGSLAATRAIADAHGARHLPVSRLGAGAARNAGLHVATGDYLAFLDDDDRWLPGHLRPQLQMLEARAELAGAVGQVVNVDDRGTPLLEPWPSDLPASGDVFLDFMRYCPQLGATVVRTSVRESVGGFDEALLADQDWDWHLRLAERHRIGFVPQRCVLFRQRPAGSDNSLQAQRIPYTRRVFRRHARTAWRRRPGLGLLAAYQRVMSPYVADFWSAAAHRCGARDYDGAWRQLALSLRLLPVVTLNMLRRSPAARRTLLRTFLRR